ncbi:serine protease [Pseudogemmobacter faecipullorum]|uniref:Peptidoglycan-binding protein n=1 Tax=Pseudogemmobacter faecipullorum TaxID=2755041 RepID=A0ABS8CMF9_9RHOB|nr:peptidoglycan-binding protein [Pseudogemmobacter faecipullorum]
MTARMTAMRLYVFFAAVTLFILQGPAGFAQERRWIQVEARPNIELARERAFAFSTTFTETWGYGLPSGWFAIVLGPYSGEEASQRIGDLKLRGVIPADSYLTDGSEFRDQFWPEGGAAAGMPGLALPAEVEVSELPGSDTGADEGADPEAEAALSPAEAAASEPVVERDNESPAEARASEALMSEEERKALQAALQWFGFYEGGLDGAYGPGTRKAMAAWQQAFAQEATGVLTSRQRATLMVSHQAEVAEYGFALVEEQESGIDVTLPLSLVEFDRYEPPFVHFREKNGSGLSLVLISQPGDQGSLSGLYDILSQLEAMPEGMERQLSETAFSLRGQDASRVARAAAKLDQGLIKGWMLLSDPANALRDSRAIEVMEASFRAVGDTALDPGLVPLDEAARRGLVAGLEVQKPKLSRSGFYVSADGQVLTEAGLLASCGRITLDHSTGAELVLSDASTGLALLKPKKPLAPQAFAGFAAGETRPGAPVAVSGYPWEGRLSAPVLSHGSFEEPGGLNGETGVIRIAAGLRSGNAGGPVLDTAGAVIGMVLPPAQSGPALPGDVAFAADSKVIADFLSRAGLKPAETLSSAALPPETLTRQASAMTVLVSCWP